MDRLRTELIWLRDWLAWLPDPVAAVLIIVLAALIALVLHGWVRRLLRRALALRYPVLFTAVTQMRGLTRLALLIIALAIALPVAPLAPETRFWLARILLDRRHRPRRLGGDDRAAHRRHLLSAPLPPRRHRQPDGAQARHAGARAATLGRRAGDHRDARRPR